MSACLFFAVFFIYIQNFSFSVLIVLFSVWRGIILEDSVKSKILIYCSCLLMEINGPICNKGSQYPGNSLFSVSISLEHIKVGVDH